MGPTWGYIQENPLVWWEILGIYGVSMYFILKNVIPKFTTFGGARRHYNDVKDPEEKGLKKFMTKSYIRLAFHILSGMFQVMFAGGYVMAPQFWNSIFSFTFLQRWFIFWDTVHELTGWLMTRGHDGIFAVRAYNLAFMVVKLFFCGQISRMTAADNDFVALVGGLFILTSGFAWVRFTCALFAIAQCVLYDVDMTVLLENWYSMGLWVGQFAIGVRCQVLGEYHLTFAFCALYFPIELWVKKQAHHKYTTLLFTFGLAPMYFVESNHLAIQMAIGVFFWVYTTWFAGTYWKRAPIPGIDYDDKIKDKRMKRKQMLRQPSYRHVLPKWVNDFINEPSLAPEKSIRARVRNSLRQMRNYNKKFQKFQRRDSAARMPLVRKPMQKSKTEPLHDRIRKSLHMTPQSIMKKDTMTKQKSLPKKLTFDSFIEENEDASIIAAQVAYRDQKARARRLSQGTLLKNLASMSMADIPSDSSYDSPERGEFSDRLPAMSADPLKDQIAALLASHVKKDPAALAALIMERVEDERWAAQDLARMQGQFNSVSDNAFTPLGSLNDMASMSWKRDQPHY